MPEKPYNHFDGFCKYLRENTTLSESFKDDMIRMFMAAQSDAFVRGENAERLRGV
jgi:hypothetical protein